MKPSSDDSPNTSRNTSEKRSTFSISCLELKADTLLCETFPTGVSVPVDIDFIAENRLQLEIFPVPGLEANFSVFGAFWKIHDEKYKLIIDQDVMDYQPALYRFTVGEEIAHYVLHRDHFAEVKGVKEACQVQAKLRVDLHHMERNAKWFSSALLMPNKAVREAANRTYATLIAHVGFANPDAVLKQVVSLLAKQFEVSPQAMRHRLENHPCKVTHAVARAIAAHHKDLWGSGS